MLRFLTAGESHGRCLTAILEGMPAGLQIDLDGINRVLARRQGGYGRGGRMQIERDQVEFLAGVRFGETLGSPISLKIENRDWANWQDTMAAVGPKQGAAVTAPRPGHADLAGSQKYDRRDIRDILERASARETAVRTAVGAVAAQLLAKLGIRVAGHVTGIGEAVLPPTLSYTLDQVRNAADYELGCLDAKTAERMRAVIDEAGRQGDTVGGVFEVVVAGLPVGLGSHVHWDRRLDARLAGALMSIPAVKGVEIGAGFAYGRLRGSQAHDEIILSPDGGFKRLGNQAGGLEGGMTNGEVLVVRAVMKPIPTLRKALRSVDIVSKLAVQAAAERSDVCAVPAAAVVGEAVVAFELANAVLEKFGGDTIQDVLSAAEHYRRRLCEKL